ncbi:MAG: ribonuclease HII [Piscirickettsiaceae bacterium]|nr:MAG: ribonuclease HII [Piscirickettsiaceae bacterium]
MKRDNLLIVGLDEVGRGCIAGPVVAAAVILNKEAPINGLADSKTLTKLKREKLAIMIKENSLAWGIGRAEVVEIDIINILQASLLAMKRAYQSLSVKADFAQVDGIFYPEIPINGECIKGGDNLIQEISAASIIAKVYRDDHMNTLDVLYPGYGLEKHKGYPTKQHKQALEMNGISAIHRRSFSPVKMLLNV